MKKDESFRQFRDSLTPRFFAVFSSLQLVGVLSLSFRWLFPAFCIALTAFVALAIFDRRYLLKKDALKLSGCIQWDPPGSPVIGNSATMFFSGTGEGSWNVSLRLPASKTLEISNGFTELKKDRCEIRALAYRLGYETLDSAWFRSVSRMGLWARNGRISIAPITFRIIPTEKEISEDAFRQIMGHQSIFLQGNRKIMRGSAAEQFHSVRNFQPSDPLRYIDHKKSAKYGRWMTRTYEQYLNQHLIIALDLGRSLTGQLGKSSKVDYYASVCLSLARDGIRNSDHVSFIAFSQKVHYAVRKTRQLSSFLPLYEGHPSLLPQEQESDWEILPHFLREASAQKNLVLVFTDAARPSVQSSLLRVVPQLSSRNLVVVLSLLDSEFTLQRKIREPLDLRNADSYGHLLYSYWLNERSRVFRTRLSHYGAGAVYVSEEDWLSAVRKTYDLMRFSNRI